MAKKRIFGFQITDDEYRELIKLRQILGAGSNSQVVRLSIKNQLKRAEAGKI